MPADDVLEDVAGEEPQGGVADHAHRGRARSAFNAHEQSDLAHGLAAVDMANQTIRGVGVDADLESASQDDMESEGGVSLPIEDLPAIEMKHFELADDLVKGVVVEVSEDLAEGARRFRRGLSLSLDARTVRTHAEAASITTTPNSAPERRARITPSGRVSGATGRAFTTASESAIPFGGAMRSTSKARATVSPKRS